MENDRPHHRRNLRRPSQEQTRSYADSRLRSEEVRNYTTETRQDVSELKEQVFIWQKTAEEVARIQLKASRRELIVRAVLGVVGVAVAGAVVVDVMQQREAFRATQAEINLIHGMLRGCFAGIR